MKTSKYLTNFFAIVGVISFIIAACSVADNNNNSASENNLGKYQITASPNSNMGKFHVIDTETGVVKTFETYSNNGDYVLLSTTTTQ